MSRQAMLFGSAAAVSAALLGAYLLTAGSGDVQTLAAAKPLATAHADVAVAPPPVAPVATTQCEEQTWPYIARSCLSSDGDARKVRVIGLDKVGDGVAQAQGGPAGNRRSVAAESRALPPMMVANERRAPVAVVASLPSAPAPAPATTNATAAVAAPVAAPAAAVEQVRPAVLPDAAQRPADLPVAAAVVAPVEATPVDNVPASARASRAERRAAAKAERRERSAARQTAQRAVAAERPQIVERGPNGST